LKGTIIGTLPKGIQNKASVTPGQKVLGNGAQKSSRQWPDKGVGPGGVVVGGGEGGGCKLRDCSICISHFNLLAQKASRPF